MAALAKLQARVDRELTDGFFTAVSETCARAADEHNAATRIQAHVRGWLLRQAFARRMAAVVALQSGVRGMQGRKLAAEQQVMRAKAEREEFFSRCAGLVQRHWRGYRSRKHVHDFYARRRWLEHVLKVTEELRVEMQAMHEQQKQDVELQEQLEYTKLFQESLHDKHHLMGTKARPGAMSRTTRDGRSMDEHLRDSLRRMTHDPPDQPLVTIEKPQFVTYWHTEHVFDNYDTSPAPAPRSSRVAKLRLPQR